MAILTLVATMTFLFSTHTSACEHPLHDQIHACDFANDSACAKAIMDKVLDLALQEAPAPYTPTPGTYTSGGYTMQITVSGRVATISGDSTIGEKGDYVCDENGCQGAEYSFVVTDATHIDKSYVRTWTRN